MPLSYRQAGNLFVAGPNITIYPSGNSFAISGSASGGGGSIISGTNIGTGVGVFSSLTTINNPNDSLAFYTLSGTDQGSVFLNDSGEIIISRGGTVVNTLSNQGGGSIIYSSITTNNITVRTFLASSSGFTVALVNNPSVTGATSAITANTLVRITPTNATADRFYINSSTGTLDVPAAATLSPLAASATMGIAATPLATTRLLIGAGSTIISQIRLTPFSTEPTNPSDGDVWFTTSGNTLKFEKGTVATDFIFKDNNISLSGYSNILVVDTGGTITPRYVNLFGVFNTLSSVTVANTSTETSIISSVFTGSTTILASTNPNNPELVVGKKFRFNAKGTIQTDNTNTLEVKIKLGSTTIGTTTAFNVKDNINALTYFEIDNTFTIRNSGIVSCNGKIFASEIIQDSPNINIKGITNQNATVATTSDQVFDCTVTFDQAQPNNIITINESTLEFLN